MKKFTKSISSIIMLCLLLAGNNVYSKNNPFSDNTNPTTRINKNIDANSIKFVPPATPVISNPPTRSATSITFTTPTDALATSYLVERKANMAQLLLL
jgi:small neutral amino acid transporter SnatA (MarC family)